jgi:predicted Rossmann fold flavoprotein
VKSVSRRRDRFVLEMRTGEEWECDRLFLATGSSPAGHRWAKELGHHIIPPVPSLFTFQIADPRLQGLAGVSVPQVQVHLMAGEKQKLSQSGGLLITHWGLSGPAILKLSAWGARILHDRRYRMGLRVNWLPHLSRQDLQGKLEAQKQRSPRKRLFTEFDLPLPKRLWQRLAGVSGIGAGTNWADLSKKQLSRLVLELSQGEYAIQGKGAFKEEFVTCGGVDLKEIDFKTMESKICPGLFFAGEILDIDGVTGGFNFQSAWTTGWLAGKAMGKAISPT